MNKTELKNAVAEDTGITKKEAGIMLNSVIECIKDGLAGDGKVPLVGFGTFSLAARKARTARNPKTGEAVDVPAKTVPKFKPSAILKAQVVNIDLDSLGDEPEAPVETPEADEE